MEGDYLDKVPLRDQTLVGVGGVLYLAASPDEYDGLSEAEFQQLKKNGPAVFQVYEQLGKVGLPENFRLPEGFANHFANEVLNDVEIIRQDPAKREEFRREIRAVFNNPSHVKKLYRQGGTTWSDIASQVAGTNRSGKFYSEDRRKPSERVSNERLAGSGISTLEKVETTKGKLNAPDPIKVATEAIARHPELVGGRNGRSRVKGSIVKEVSAGAGIPLEAAGDLIADTLIRLPTGKGLDKKPKHAAVVSQSRTGKGTAKPNRKRNPKGPAPRVYGGHWKQDGPDGDAVFIRDKEPKSNK